MNTPIIDYLNSKELKGLKSDEIKRRAARRMHATMQMPRGRCQVCCRDFSGTNDKLVPIVMNVCKGCAARFQEKTGCLRVTHMKFLPSGFYCDWCLGKAFRKITCNPFVCEYCLRKVGRWDRKFRPNLKDLRRND